MTIRNLEYLFKPKSVALIGASTRPGSIGSVVAKNLFGTGFDGPIMPVNPKRQSIAGVLAYPDIASLPVTPDLAIICTPPDTVPGIVAELGERGTRAAVVVTAGLGSGGYTQPMLDAARPHLMRIVGPNCLGILVPGMNLNASFAHVTPLPGNLAFVAQSGAIVTAVTGWAHERGIGFSHLVSLGDMADVDFGDMMDYLANDKNTRAILLYIEAIQDARKFMSAARAAARMKPVIVVKAGREEEGAAAAASHTGALAGSDAVYDAAFRRSGMLRVFSLSELFDAVETLAMTQLPKGDRLTIVTNGGGIGVMATDSLIEAGGKLAPITQKTIKALDAVLPPTWSRANPVDIIGDAPGSRFKAALETVMQDEATDAILVLACPTAVASFTDAAQAVVEVAEKKKFSLLTSWVGNGTARPARKLFSDHRIPSFETPEQAVRAFMYLVNYRRNQDALMETPVSHPEEFTPDVETAQAIVNKVIDEGREWLTEPEAKTVLAAYGIPVAMTRVAASAQEAASMAAEMGGSVAVKILSNDITHKSDVGGVALGLDGPAAVRDAANAMLDRVRKVHPDAKIDGFSVQPMVRRPDAFELIIGVSTDINFGPTIMFGHGGTGVEVVEDTALALPPLNMSLAHEVMSRTRIHKQLRGYRSRPGVNLEAVALTLVKVSQLIIDIDGIEEIDINPLLADEFGVVALDARVKAAKHETSAANRLAIRPYPKQLEEDIPLGDGRILSLRPIRPEDEPSLIRTFEKLTPEEIRLRFFVPMKTMSHFMAARFTQIDYDREMALILTEKGIAGHTNIYGTVRISADPDNESAEYAVLVVGDMTGMGLGVMLMRRIIEYCQKRGLKELHGEVLRENTTMLKLCKVLGFEQHGMPDEPELVKVSLKL